MITSINSPNKLINEKSPYLLQHVYNPVDWQPWGEEAFEKARQEDKPVFLSIGYSTCHWCHVMERESFEDEEVAAVLNAEFVSVKVDREERPDVDSVYMSACMALNGSGGWPLTIIMDASGKPFFAGTYLPKHGRFGSVGLMELLEAVSYNWAKNRAELKNSGARIAKRLRSSQENAGNNSAKPDELINKAAEALKSSFDRDFGGFGIAPKFPSPHNLIFLMELYKITGKGEYLQISEKTLLQMYKGGLFDHIGYGFSRYSTDRQWLIPHFEKMLYDNALLIMAYTKAFGLTGNGLYRKIAEKTAQYVLRELTDPDGGFYSAEDADSDGVEGKYYVFAPDEIINVLGRENGKIFNEYFDIAKEGNFENKNIPNLIKNNMPDNRVDPFLPAVYEYRRKRTALHKDDKSLTSWNALMTAALAEMHIVFGDEGYLSSAIKAAEFIENNLSDEKGLCVSFRDGKKSGAGFIDDYAFYVYALIKLYNATLDGFWLERAEKLTRQAIDSFFDHENGGFFLYGVDSEKLLYRPKECYDGAIPSGNSVMAMNLQLLAALSGNGKYGDILDKQIEFMASKAADYPAGHCFYLLAMLEVYHPTKKIIAVLKDGEEVENVKEKLPKNALVTLYEGETEAYKRVNGETTYFVCEDGVCKAPSNVI